MKAEEFYKKRLEQHYSERQISELIKSNSHKDKCNFAEAYHKHRVESISYKDAAGEFNRFHQQCLDNCKGFEPYDAFIKCFKWFKQQLINNI